MATEWRSHPDLASRFHPQAPDDLQVVVHDGGPLTTPARPELVWVRVTAAGPDGTFRGTVLNVPEQLRTVARGQEITFVPTHAEHVVMVTSEYLAERGQWVIEACEGCGNRELFDPPSSLVAATFPDMKEGDTVEAFTTRCGLCGGTQIVSDADASSEPGR